MLRLGPLPPRTHLPSVRSSGSGTRGRSPSPPSRGCTDASAAQGAALGQGGQLRGAQATPALPPTASRLRLPQFTWEGPGLPLRNSRACGSRSQQPGVLGELRSHLNVAWKAFFRTWSRQSRAAGPGVVRGELACLPPLCPPCAPVPALGHTMGPRGQAEGGSGFRVHAAEAPSSGRAGIPGRETGRGGSSHQDPCYVTNSRPPLPRGPGSHQACCPHL